MAANIPLGESSIIIPSSLFTFNSLIVCKYISGLGLLSLNCSPLTISVKYFLKSAWSNAVLIVFKLEEDANAIL